MERFRLRDPDVWATQIPSGHWCVESPRDGTAIIMQDATFRALFEAAHPAWDGPIDVEKLQRELGLPVPTPPEVAVSAQSPVFIQDPNHNVAGWKTTLHVNGRAYAARQVEVRPGLYRIEPDEPITVNAGETLTFSPADTIAEHLASAPEFMHEPVATVLPVFTVGDVLRSFDVAGDAHDSWSGEAPDIQESLRYAAERIKAATGSSAAPEPVADRAPEPELPARPIKFREFF